ncbi:penicillin-binding protein [Paenibacillus psychroresistens]|uniref:Penicillin-binding protein n=1 Tax=Paenibacillus psychroresistens TaxID=1778678 RepID=A0A6B8RTL8_9BACL|nr:transglycosylase domain-containing protein [Paenibacillus psychroresistens]QGQ99237.1 penicillin-binding protein [Paenibacillus psychroresistens]
MFRWSRLVQTLLSVLFLCFIVSAVALFALFLYLRAQSLPVTTVTQTSQIFDIHDEVIDSFHGTNNQNRHIVALKDIAPTLVQATLAIEDHRFYEHWGFDPRGMARAVLKDVKTLSKEQGASTITQQLARNLYLTHDRTWTRKIKEAMYAMQMEMQLSKDQILEQYLNQIYYGHAAYGIEAASLMFLGKSSKDLTLAESALLAGIPKGPKFYSPYLDMKNAKDRQKIILEAMVKYDYITQTEADQALHETLNIIPKKEEQSVEAPYFRDYVKTLAIDKLGINDTAFDAGGIKIFTTLDLTAQRVAEKAIAEQMNSKDELQVALIAIDPRNGYIKAMVGGKDYNTNQFNRVFATTRQPGSSFKPFVYLTALANHFTVLNQYKSEPTEFTYDDGKKTYTPNNFDDQYEKTEIDMRKAIAKSDNIYAVHTIIDVGADKVIEMAHKMGITSELKPLPSLALGTFPVSPFEMAGAFGIIANQGIKAETTAIIRIEDSQGHVLYEDEPEKQQVVEAPYTYVLTNLMQSVFEQGGTGYRVANIMKRPVAGKTGTTDTDSWMVGFTPELSTAVWVGYDRDRSINSLESRKAAPIFAEFTEGALSAVPPKLFEVPADVVNVYIDPVSGKLANDACPDSRMEAFVMGSEPTEYCAKAIGNEPTNKGNDHNNSSWWNNLKSWWND